MLVICVTTLIGALLVVSQGASAASKMVSRRVVAAADDARSTELGTFTSNETALQVGSGDGQRPNVVGLRFTNLTIPRGAIIDSATLTMTKRGAQVGRLVADVSFEFSDSAAPFSAGANE